MRTFLCLVNHRPFAMLRITLFCSCRPSPSSPTWYTPPFHFRYLANQVGLFTWQEFALPHATPVTISVSLCNCCGPTHYCLLCIASHVWRLCNVGRLYLSSRGAPSVRWSWRLEWARCSSSKGGRPAESGEIRGNHSYWWRLDTARSKTLMLNLLLLLLPILESYLELFVLLFHLRHHPSSSSHRRQHAMICLMSIRKDGANLLRLTALVSP